MDYKNLGSLVTIQKGRKNNIADSYDEKSKRIIQIQDLRNDDNIIYTNDEKGLLVNEDDVLIAWDGANAGLVGFEKNGFLGSTLSLLRSKNKKVFFSAFLGRFLNTKFDYFQKTATGATIPHLNRLALEELIIPLPSYVDQIRIANILGKIENVIKARKNAIDQLDELVKATFYDMFGDPVRNDKGWDKLEIKFFGKVITGNTPKRKIKEYYDAPYIEWIKTDNIESNKIYLSKAKEHLSEKGVELGRLVEEGGLLINCIAGSIKSIGKVAIADRKVAFNQQINAIQLNENIEPFFMYWLLNICNEYIQSFASGAMKFILSKSAFESIELIKPDPIHQHKFATIAQKIEKIKTEQEKQLLEIEALYSSVSHDAFSGTLDLSRIPYDENLLPNEKLERDIDTVINQDPLVINPLEETKIDFSGIDNDTSIEVDQFNEKVNKIPKGKFGFSAVEHYTDWKDISFSIVADLVKKNFGRHYFNTEMLLNYLQNEEKINVAYYTSTEKKKKPELDNDEDFYGFIESCITGRNPFLEIDQTFYDAVKHNILNITFNEKDLELLSKKAIKDRSGIYFRIKNEITTR
ncbi:restriction endonuclease subunit S [Sphingobacterium sp. WOUb80]|uniref:restriction endonuclease subunit S n=1 Tax=Sphingobacterium sp. WOUb80 TaxID=3234028 RepID=UPI003CF8F1F1